MLLFWFIGYKVLCEIGEGSYSKVLKCRKRDTSDVFACKRLKHAYRRWRSFSRSQFSPPPPYLLIIYTLNLVGPKYQKSPRLWLSESLWSIPIFCKWLRSICKQFTRWRFQSFLLNNFQLLSFDVVLPSDPNCGRVSLVFELMEMNLYELIKDRKRQVLLIVAKMNLILLLGF